VAEAGVVATAENPLAAVPPAEPPDSSDAWYAPETRTQYEVLPGLVATVSETAAGFRYEVRSPSPGDAGEAALEAVRDHFGGVRVDPPLTREGAFERAAAWFPGKYRRALDRLLEVAPATRRRVEYHAMCELRLFGDLTPLALDDRVRLADAADGTPGSSSGDGDRAADDEGRLVVHTEEYAPARTDFPADAPRVERILARRLARYTVPFHGFDVPVVLRRERLLGDDDFTVKYAVREPDLLPGDEALIEECKERIWETNVSEVVADREVFVTERARAFLSRRLTARNTRAWVAAARHRFRSALAEYDLAVPPVGGRYAGDRLDDLVYYVLRDYVGHGVLTVPVRDPHLEDIEANRVGERVKVVPRPDALDVADAESLPNGLGRRVPTNLAFDDERAFVNVVTQLAAEDGTELSASSPSAKVNLDPEGVEETIRCAVALPVVSEDGPHVSVRKQSTDAMTPVDLLARDALSTELVALLWICYEHDRVVLFSGPTGVGKTTLMNAHMPFIPFDHRPISIDEGSREVRLPHETGVSLTTRDHESEYKRVTMADLMTETNYLNPDVEVIAEINTPESFRTFAETLNTGHGVVGTTHAEGVETLVNRVIEQGLPAYLLREIDLVVFPHRSGTDRYVSRAVELLSAEEHDALESNTVEGRGGAGVVTKDGREVHWNTVAWRDTEGEYHLDYDHPDLGDDGRRVGVRLFERLADVTDRPVEAVEAEFHRKHRYVQYVAREGIDDFEALFSFLADLRTDEAGTVARARAGTADRRPTERGEEP
jgi:type IV secretory pathway ATPase VirB11/archaellum biosynthesis ATPase